MQIANLDHHRERPPRYFYSLAFVLVISFQEVYERINEFTLPQCRNRQSVVPLLIFLEQCQNLLEHVDCQLMIVLDRQQVGQFLKQLLWLCNAYLFKPTLLHLQAFHDQKQGRLEMVSQSLRNMVQQFHIFSWYCWEEGENCNCFLNLG